MMKRIFTLLLAIIIFALSMPMALAAKDGLMIDNQNVYEGMTRSYSKGYKPVVKDGKAIIILPLIYEGSKKIVGDKITVTPDLGATADSPFSYSNYEMSVTLAKNPVNQGKSMVSGFLVRLEVPLEKGRLNGTYPILLNTSFTLESTEPFQPSTEEGEMGGMNQGTDRIVYEEIEKTFTVYLTIADGKDPNAQEPEPEPEPEPGPRPQPKIIVDEYEINPETIKAGDPFDVKLSLKNTEKKWSAINIKVTYRGETEDILSASKTNTFFIDEIPKGDSHELTLHMKARTEAEPKPQKVLLIIEYEDSARTPYTVNEEILLELRQPLRLEMDEVNIPSTVNAGDSLPITTNIFNMGRSTLYNVRCSIEMPGVIPEGSAFIGNMEPGSTGNVEIYAFFGTLDMGGKTDSQDSGEESNGDGKTDEDTSRNQDDEIPKNQEAGKYGVSKGVMTIAYEDEYGEEHTKTLELSTTIERPVFHSDDNGEQEPEEKPERASQWWVSIALTAGLGMILFGGISYRRKVNKLKAEYGDEDI